MNNSQKHYDRTVEDMNKISKNTVKLFTFTQSMLRKLIFLGEELIQNLKTKRDRIERFPPD